MTPLIVAASTALLVLIIDLVVVHWRATLGVALLGSLATLALFITQPGARLFCVSESCSYYLDDRAKLIGAVMAALTIGALLLYSPWLSSGDAPAGESCFLLTCAMTGGVVIGGAGDLLTLIVGLETLTLPLYALVALHRRRAAEGASGSVTFFITSVVATAITLLGAALWNLATGTVYLRSPVVEIVPLGVAGLVLLLAGLAFKVAAVPLHAWAPSTYDGAPVPVAAFLSTASKLGGVVAILLVVSMDLSLARTAGLTVAVLAVSSMVIGTLVALRQDRTVRLLAWSSVAQAGFILAPLAGLFVNPSRELMAAVLAYTLIFVVLEMGAFAGLMSLRPAGADGGTLTDLNGRGRGAPLRAVVFALALVGLAGLPPTLAGLFAKVVVVRSLLEVGTWGIALLVALVSVAGLAVYWRPLVALYRGPVLTVPRPGWSTTAALTISACVAVVLSVFPQLVLGF